MPRRDGAVVRMEHLSLAERLRQLDHCQDHWYKLAARYAVGQMVLDVGAGTGCGLSILAAAAAAVTGIDPLPAGPGVLATPVEQFADGSFDLVTAMDVIEHVQDDVAFLGHLVRVARAAVFLSTPNWDYLHAQNPYHFREYTAGELDALLRSTGCSYEAWHLGAVDLIPRAVPRLGPDATNFGVLLHKAAAGRAG